MSEAKLNNSVTSDWNCQTIYVFYFAPHRKGHNTKKATEMTENFDRAPGAGRAHIKPRSPGLADVGDGDATYVFNQREPLRQPRTSPPLTENNPNHSEAIGGGKIFCRINFAFTHSHYLAMCVNKLAR